MYNCPMYSKELLKGTLSVIILNLLSENGRMYGYEISQRVKERSEDKILLKDGSLYPALQKMTKDGLLTFEEEYIGKRVRKYYSLTKKGKAEKLVYMEELKDFIDTINKLVFKFKPCQFNEISEIIISPKVFENTMENMSNLHELTVKLKCKLSI